MADFSRTSEVLAEAQRTARRLVVDGNTWLVYQLPPLPFDRRSTDSLVFENENVVRRVRNYPPDWRLLDDEKLFALSQMT